MATFTPAFHNASHRVHGEHQLLLNELTELNIALDELVCYSEVYADLAAAQRVCRCGHHLAELLPEHFVREESTVLATIAKVSPELREFAREMVLQHQQLRRRLDSFSSALADLERAEDIDAAVFRVKEEGKRLARELTDHIVLEENELDGFLPGAARQIE